MRGSDERWTEYELGEALHAGVDTRVIRATTREGRPVILKIAAAATAKQGRARHEAAVLASLAGLEGVARLSAVVDDAGRFALVLEDAGPWSLKEVLRQRGTLPLERALALAHELACALDGVHRAGVVHKDVKPQNIVIDGELTRATLVDFGLASRLAFEATSALIPEALEGTLAYIAPEQTGRTARSLDARADLYSLGVTLFEMLAGRRPFLDADPLALVYAHLAVPPPSLDSLVAGIPAVVSALVARLLAKAPEHRYQTAHGLAFDLERALGALRATGAIGGLTLGEKDFSPRLLLPEMVVGREHEAAQVRSAFHRAAHGDVEVLLVGGPSGIGKTALVRSVYRDIAAQHAGLLLTGKHDQLGRSTPYAALAQAFGGLMTEIAASPKETFASWKARLADALGASARVIADVVPELEWVLGKPAPLPDVPPEMAYNRIKLTWIEFVRAVTDASAPLVLFLDDMQWADAASLELLKVLLTDVGRGQLLVIAAYRDNEVDAGHPLWSLVGAVEKTGIATPRLAVRPLDDERVAEWLALALSSTAERVAPLARALRRKTEGNPFFLGQLLLDLAGQKHLWRDLASGAWGWDASAVERIGVTDNVVALMRARVVDLPAETQDLLGQAACAGHAFALRDLCVLTGWSAAETTAALWPALVAGLVMPNDGQYRDAQALASQTDETDLDARYHFLHDRVQQAFHEGIARELRAATHLLIGRRLQRAYIRDGGTDQKLLELVRHLSEGAAAMESDSERRDLARLELAAARAAKRAGSHGLAATLADQASLRLTASRWHDEPQLACDLALERIEAAYMQRDFDGVHRRGEELLARSLPALARLQVHELRLQAAIASGEYAEGERLGLAAFAEQGIHYPETDAGRMELAVDGLKGLDAWLDEHPDGVSTMPLDPSVEHKVRDSIASVLATCAAIGGREALAAAVVIGSMRSAVDTGRLTVSAPYFAATLGSMRPAVTNEYLGSLRWAREGERAARRVGSPFLAECCGLAANYSMHALPAERAREGLQAALAAGLSSGSFQGTSWALALELNYLDAWSGRPLRQVAAKEAAGRAMMSRVGDAFGRHVFELTASFADFLLSEGPLPREEDGWLAHGSAYFTAVQDGTTAELARVAEAHLYLMFGAHTRALARADEADRHRHAIHANPPVTDIEVWRGLAAARCADGPERTAHLATLAGCIARVRRYAEGCAENFGHKLRLLEAELARLEGRDTDAMAAYEAALGDAQAEGFLHIEALAAQLCTDFHLAGGRRLSAASFLERALDAYGRWDANRAVAHLRRRHADLLPAAPPGGATATARVRTVMEASSHRSIRSAASLFEVETAIRSSQALATERSPDLVVARLMELVAKNAGAPRATLLLGPAEDLQLTAQVDVSRAEPVRTGLHGGLASCGDVSAGMVELVARSRQPLVLGDARRDPRFAGDPRVVASDVRSVLVTPLEHQGRLLGVLYLEHPEPWAFTAQRLTLVSVLASQSGIALENARLYAAQAAHAEELERRVEDRTGELRAALARLERELAGAAAYVRGLLPAPIADAGSPVATDWRFVPCAELGGDAFDYLWLDENRFAFYMIDVCGHGVGPAMQSLTVLRSIRARQLEHADLSDPAAICAAANAAFGGGWSGDHYFTMWYGVYDVRHRRLRYTSAGHPAALLVPPSESAHVVELVTDAAPVALMPEASFENAEQHIAPGSRLYVLTDGVYEIEHPDGSLLPYEQVRAELVAGSRLQRREALERVWALAYQAHGGRTLADDFSLLALDFRG